MGGGGFSTADSEHEDFQEGTEPQTPTSLLLDSSQPHNWLNKQFRN